MKKYETPEITIKKFNSENIVTLSIAVGGGSSMLGSHVDGDVIKGIVSYKELDGNANTILQIN